MLATNQWIDLAVDRHLIEMQRETLERAAGLFALGVFGFRIFLLAGGRRRFGNAVRNKIHHIKS